MLYATGVLGGGRARAALLGRESTTEKCGVPAKFCVPGNLGTDGTFPGRRR